MKGVVFTEFMELVEDEFSYEVADQVIEESELDSGGVYTSLGTYSYRELLSMVTKLSTICGAPISALVHRFGIHLSVKFAEGYPVFYENKDLFSFLEGVEGFIHVEVRKLYADAELPSFETERKGDDQLIMRYSSSRPFADLAHGLIEGAAKQFKVPVEIEIEHTSPDAPGTAATFTITLV